MTIERIIATPEAGALVAGLTWRPVTGGKHSRKSLEEARMHLEASHFVVKTGAAAASYGFFVPRPSEENEKLPKGAVAAAGVFAAAVGENTPNAALLVSLAGEDRCYLITLDDGVPTLDMVGERRAVLDALGEEPRPVWTDLDDLAGHFAHEHADLAWLQGLPAAKTERLQPVPVNVWPAVLATAAIVLLAGGWFAWSQHKKAVERQRIEQEAIEADPLPKYMEALNARRSSMFSDRDAVLRIADSISNLPAKVMREGTATPVWQLFTVECAAKDQYCDATWLRIGGTFAELKAAFPGMSLVLESKSGASPSLDQAVMRFKSSWPRAAKASPKLVNFEQAFTVAGSSLQMWKTAGMTVDMKTAMTWPRAAGVADTFVAPNGVKAGEITVSTVPGMFLSEVIQTAPNWLSWEYLRLEILANSPTPATSLKFTLTGTYYVASK